MLLGKEGVVIFYSFKVMSTHFYLPIAKVTNFS